MSSLKIPGKRGSKDKKSSSRPGSGAVSPTTSISSASPVNKQSTVTIAAPTVSPAVTTAKAGSRKKGTEHHGGLTASLPLEEFFLTNLVEDRVEKLLVVLHSEPIASVLDQLHKLKMTSCVVNLATGEQEIFDCMDFGSYLLEVMTGGASTPEELRTAAADWQAVKRKLRRVAQEPVRKALRGSLARSTKHGAGEPGASFTRFDSKQSLESLIPQLKSQRPVPLFRGNDLCLTLSASDVLEICLSMSDESRQMLESSRLHDVIMQSPAALSKVGVSEGQSLLEVIHLMREANVHVVPILACSTVEDGATSPTFGKGVELQAGGQDTAASPRPLVGQFDIASLRSMYVKAPLDGEESPRGQWWWENASVTENLLLENVVDFLTLGPTLAFEENVPFAAVLSSEPLTKAISRCIASPHHSVVVYQVDAHTAKGSSSKPLVGLASSLSLVTGMLEAGLFQKLVFDTSKHASVRKHGHVLKRPTHTSESMKVALELSEGIDPNRSVRIKFEPIIELEGLVVPGCPLHSLAFLRFHKEEENTRIMDFSALKDAALESKTQAVGATASCLACQRSLGRVGAAAAPAAVPAAAPACPACPVLRSALKAGTPGAGKGMEASLTGKSANAEAKSSDAKPSRSDRQGGEASRHGAADPSAPSGWSFVDAFLCCSSSKCMSATKDTISAVPAAEKDPRKRSSSDASGRSNRWLASDAAAGEAAGGDAGGAHSGRRSKNSSSAGSAPKAR